MEKTEHDKVAGWFAGRVPDGWFTGPPSVTVDDEQVLVVGTLAEPALPEGASADLKAGVEAGRISRFREATRPYRIAIAREMERELELPVTWGAACGGTTVTFNPGGSGWRRKGEAEAEGEATKVMIHGRRRRAMAWRRRFAFGGPRAWRGGPWQPWRGDVQSF
jgi:hypothetical protein